MYCHDILVAYFMTVDNKSYCSSFNVQSYTMKYSRLSEQNLPAFFDKSLPNNALIISLMSTI